ncbi:MAG: DUF3333 domain-containing protein, partial [Chromatiales bacterium]
MSNQSTAASGREPGAKRPTIEIVRAGMARRRAAEMRFRWYGRIAIGLGLLFLSLLFISIIGKGYTAFVQSYVKLDIELSSEVLGVGPDADRESLARADYGGAVKAAMREMFPEVSGRSDRRALYSLVSQGADFQLRDRVLEDPSLIGQRVEIWVPTGSDVDAFMKGKTDRELPESDRRIKDNQIVWIERLVSEDRIEKRFNTILFTAGDSRDPELAGI